MDNLYQLVIRKGPKPGQTFPLYAITLSMGRDPISDISINDPEISRQHARLTQTHDSYEIEDLESTNGTFVNGVQIGSTPVQLAHGNEIRLGSGVTLLFELMPEDFDGTIIEDGLATAVRPSSPPPATDPFMPPTLIHEESPSSAAETDPLADLENMQEELDQAFNQADAAKPEPVAAPPRPVHVPPATAAPFAPPAPAKDNNPIRRLIALGAVLIFLMLCCCCGLLFVIYQWGGDWLLQQMGMVP